MCSGLEAEGLTIQLLRKNGKKVTGFTNDAEDMFLKVDLWLLVDGYWIPIQLSLDKKEILGKKGLRCLKIGIVPMWIDGDKLDVAIQEDNGIGLVEEFCERVKKILATFPKMKKFSKACWDLRLEVK